MVVLLGAGPSQPSSGPPPPPAGDLVLDADIFRYGGAELRFYDRVERWVDALGQPSRRRVDDEMSETCIWDALGLGVGARRTPDGRAYVTQVLLHVAATDDPRLNAYVRDQRREHAAWAPTGRFAGRIVLEGAALENGPNEAARLAPQVTTGVFDPGLVTSRHPRNMSLEAWSPGGTGVTGSAVLYCDLPEPHAGHHHGVFDAIEFGAAWPEP